VTTAPAASPLSTAPSTLGPAKASPANTKVPSAVA